MIEWSNRITMEKVYERVFAGEEQQKGREMCVKIHLRRGIAYERMEKWRESRTEYERVKRIDGANMVASQGLKRV